MPDSHQRPFSIKIFVPDGDPDSLRLIEKSNGPVHFIPIVLTTYSL